MLWFCFAAVKSDGIMNSDKHLYILTQNLLTSPRRLRLRCGCLFQKDNDPKYTVHPNQQRTSQRKTTLFIGHFVL